MDLGFVNKEEEDEPEQKGRGRKFGRSKDGNSGKTVCSRCSKEKPNSEINGVGYEWVCNDCLEESDKE